MKYDQVSSKAGSGKKKGAAQESDAQEAKNLVDDTPAQNEMKSGAGKGKKHHKKDHKKVAARKKGGAKHHGNMPPKKGSGDHKEGHKGGAKKDMMMDEKPVARKKGSAKKKGAAGFNSHTSDTHKHPHAEGPSRMGFTQNFGAARQNSYAQGAARVASIMSFGASKKKGAADAGDPAGHKHPHSGTTGSVDFSINDSGATLNKTGKTTSSTPSSSSSSSSSSSPIVDKGNDVFYNNLISSSKDMSAMSAAGINPSDKKAVLNYGNNKAKSMNSTKPSSSSTSSSSSSSNNPVTINSINSASNLKMQKMLGDVNLATYGKEMQAKQDSVTAYGQTFDKLVKNNPLNLTPQVLGEYDEISGRYGNKAANETRSNNNIPLVDSKTDMPRRSFFNGKETTPSYNNPGVPGGKSKIVNSPTTYSRPGTIFADFKSLFSGGGKRKY